MEPQERKRFCDELLRTTQLIRRNCIGNEGRYVINNAFREAGREPTDEEVEKLLAGMFPYLFGPRSIMEPLVRLSMREKPPTGQEVYNLIVLANMDKSGMIQKAYEVYTNEQRTFPRADIRLCLPDPSEEA